MSKSNKNPVVAEDVVSDDFEDVAATAQMAHYGQKRRTGEDYITHPAEVSQIVKKFYPSDKISAIVALLHDTMEDAPSMGTVKDIGEMKSFIRGSIGDAEIAEDVIDAVESLTHDKGQQPDYGAYVATILDNKFALRVKLADMLHNLSDNASDKQKKKYGDALKKIAGMSGGIPKSISPHHWRALSKAPGQDLTSSSSMMETKIMTKTQLKEYIRQIVKEQVEPGSAAKGLKERFEDFLYAWFQTNEDDLMRALEEAAYDDIKPTASELSEMFIDDIKNDTTDPELRQALDQKQGSLEEILDRHFFKFLQKNWKAARDYAMDMDQDRPGSWTDDFEAEDPYGRLAGPESDFY